MFVTTRGVAHARHPLCELQLWSHPDRDERPAPEGGSVPLTTCRKGSGAPFTTNAIWRAADVTIRGETASWKEMTVTRHFCPSCGSAMFGISDGAGEIAIGIGAFDVAPTDLVPTYELWVARREKWFQVVTGTEQFPGNRAMVA